MKWIKEFFLICMFLCAGFFHSWGGNTAIETNVFLVADSLMASGNFFEAAIAYEKVFFFSGNTQTRIKANLRRAKALGNQGEFGRAINDLQRSAHIRTFPGLHFDVLFQMAFCDYMMGNYSQALSRLKQLKHFYPEKSDHQDVLLLSSLAAIMAEDTEQAAESARLLAVSGDFDTEQEKRLLNDISMVFARDEFPKIRSQERAANLSTFLPGAGHLYAGYPARGFINAASQAISLGLTVLMAYNGLYASGFVIGLGMFQSFYFGGIRQASFLVHQRNLKEMGMYKEHQKNFVIDIMESREAASGTN